MASSPGFQPNVSYESLEALKLIECPICVEVIGRPIFQCSNGHLVCSTCSDKIKLCHTCRVQMPNPRIRNLVAESLVSLKCPNSKWGCKMTLAADEKAEHILRCEYASSDFCRRLGFENELQCNQIIKKSEISSHMKNDHKLDVFTTCQKQIIQEIDPAIANIGKKWTPITFTAFKEQFFLVTEAAPGQHGSTPIFSWKLISAGTTEVAKQFIAELTLLEGETEISLKWKGQMLSIEQLSEINLKFFNVSLDTLKQFNQKLDSLQWTITVLIKRKPMKPGNQLPSVARLPKSVATALTGPSGQPETARLEISSSASDADQPSGSDDDETSEKTFRFTVPGITNLKTEVFSPVEHIKNLPWQIRVKPNILGNNKTNSIGVYIHCDEYGSFWSCKADAYFKIISIGPNFPNYSRPGPDVSHNFNRSCSTRGHEHYVMWAALTKPERGLISNDSITIEAKVKVGVSRGV